MNQMGRFAKHGSAAERQKAYRARKNAEKAELKRLRDAVRNLTDTAINLKLIPLMAPDLVAHVDNLTAALQKKPNKKSR